MRRRARLAREYFVIPVALAAGVLLASGAMYRSVALVAVGIALAVASGLLAYRLAREVEARARELSEAREQQTATGEILRVISSSPTDVQPIMKAVTEAAARLTDASRALIGRVEGDSLRWVATNKGQLITDRPFPITRKMPSGRAILDGQTTQEPDLSRLVDEMPYLADVTQVAHVRTVLTTPLLREGMAVGVLTCTRTQVRPFTAQQIALLQTFADQAVIAIENVRLFKELEARNGELTTALEQQTATSEILRAISGAQQHLQPVFDTIVQRAVRLCAATSAAVFQVEGGMIHEPANYGASVVNLAATRARYPRPLDLESTPGVAILTRSVVQLPDTEDPALPEFMRETGRLLGVRSTVTVPMLREGEAVGAIVVTRRESGPFSDAEVELLKTFADQAVIAIENVRLFRELEEKNRAVTEALEQQTATSEILGVISSSPTNVQPVLDAIAERAARLCGASFGGVLLLEGDQLDF
jgi:two-component system, NtrC family, sensor kinase